MTSHYQPKRLFELDEPKPENMSASRTVELWREASRTVKISRESKQGVIHFGKMLSEFQWLEKVWRDVEKFMSKKKLDMASLFWNEISTPLDAEIVPEAENILPQKFELKNWVCALVYLGTFVFCFVIGFSIP